MHLAGRERRIAEVAGRVAVAVTPDMREEFLVAGTPVEAVGLVQALRRAVGAAGYAASRVVDDAPGAEAVAALIAAQHAEPIDQHADPLLEHIECGSARCRRWP